MKRYLAVAVLCLATLSCKKKSDEHHDNATPPAAQVQDVSGTWNGAMTINGLNPFNLQLTIAQNASSTSGTWATSSGVSGTMTGAISGDRFVFTLVEVTPCTGRFPCDSTLIKNTLVTTITGNDCGGNYNGTVTLSR